MKSVPLLFFGLAAINGHAEGWVQGERGALRISTDSTSNSSILVDGILPNEYDHLWVVVAVPGGSKDEDQEPVRPVGRSIHFNLYFKRGAGTYDVKIFGCPPRENTCRYMDGFTVTNTDRRDNAFLLPSSEIQSDAAEILSLARRITLGAASDLQRTTAIHDWVTSQIGYDTDAYFDSSYTKMNWDALTVIERKSSICQGYSNLTAALHRALGIRAKIVIGTASPLNVDGAPQTPKTPCNHAWNEILVDGRWMTVDTTWDAGYVDFGTKKFSFSPKKTYFDPLPAEFARTHAKCYDDKH